MYLAVRFTMRSLALKVEDIGLRWRFFLLAWVVLLTSELGPSQPHIVRATNDELATT